MADMRWCTLCGRMYDTPKGKAVDNRIAELRGDFMVWTGCYQIFLARPDNGSPEEAARRADRAALLFKDRERKLQEEINEIEAEWVRQCKESDDKEEETDSKPDGSREDG